MVKIVKNDNAHRVFIDPDGDKDSNIVLKMSEINLYRQRQTIKSGSFISILNKTHSGLYFCQS